MSIICPVYGKVLYLDCLECQEKLCKKIYENVIIGIDQSYKNTGITIIADEEIKIIKSIDLSKYANNSERRRALRKSLDGLLKSVIPKTYNIVCIIERIRLQSQGFINIDYIKGIGALNSIIVDTMQEHNIKTYSVDTRCWKAQVIGTSKPQANKYGVPEEKWPTVKWVISKGFKKSILKIVTGRKKKETFIGKDGLRYMFDNDAADSCGIAMFGIVGDKNKLVLEK